MNILQQTWQINLSKDENWLKANPDAILVYGDAPREVRNEVLSNFFPRNHLQTYGFIDRKKECPLDLTASKTTKEKEYYFTRDTYERVFYREVRKLASYIEKNPDLTFYIEPIGSWTPQCAVLGSYKLFNFIVHPKLPMLLQEFPNVVFNWDITSPAVLSYWAYVDVRDKIQVFEMLHGDELNERNISFLLNNNKTVRYIFPEEVTAASKEDALKLFTRFWHKIQYGKHKN